MNVASKKSIVIFFRYLTSFGVLTGLYLYFYVRTNRKLYRVPGLKHPIAIRKGTTDLVVFEQIFVSRNYKFKLPSSPEVIFDFGANVGFASIYFANQFPNARIIAVEPETSNYSTLVENVKSYKKIEALNKAIWTKRGKLAISDPGKGAYGFSVSEFDQRIEAHKLVAEIDCVSVKNIMEDFNVSKIDLMKVDIEGAELEIFQDADVSWLASTNAIVIELHDRLRPGCSESFVKAVATQLNFSLGGAKEGLLFIRDRSA